MGSLVRGVAWALPAATDAGVPSNSGACARRCEASSWTAVGGISFPSPVCGSLGSSSSWLLLAVADTAVIHDSEVEPQASKPWLAFMFHLLVLFSCPMGCSMAPRLRRFPPLCCLWGLLLCFSALVPRSGPPESRETCLQSRHPALVGYSLGSVMWASMAEISAFPQFSSSTANPTSHSAVRNGGSCCPAFLVLADPGPHCS